MKYVFTLLIFLAAATSGRLHAQIKKKTPNGYSTLYDYRTNNPDGSRIYYADKRSAALMKVSPGNDYKIECNDALDKDYLTDSLWGIVYKDTVYLNCKPFSGLDWYAKAEYGTGKRYLYLNIAIPLNPKYKSILGDYSQAPAVKTGGSIPKIGGLIGGAVKGAVDRLSTRIPVIYDTETGQCRCLTTELLYSFSQKYPELKSQFGLVKIEMLSVYAFRDFAEALNTADEQEKLKAKQAEQQAAEAEAKARAEAERVAADAAAGIERKVRAEACQIGQHVVRAAAQSGFDAGDGRQVAPRGIPLDDLDVVNQPVAGRNDSFSFHDTGRFRLCRRFRRAGCAPRRPVGKLR